MEFVTSAPGAPPRSLYPCLASITIAPASAGTAHMVGVADRARRMSSGSAGGAVASGDEDESVLKRVISGGRRKSSFGTGTGGDGATSAADRRKSIAPSHAHHAHGIIGGNATGQSASGPEGVEKGTWYWRVQAGVQGNTLVLLPLSQPANSLLTAPPQPLSAAMPSHSKEHGHDDEGLVDKVKNLFRRGSAHPEGANPHHAKDNQASDKIIDQTPQGDPLPPSGQANAGEGGVGINAETGWPGVINGEKLGAVVVQLSQVDRRSIAISGGKRGEASWVTVPVNSAFASMTHGFSDGGVLSKSGVIKLEFDKDWIGSKGEAELLHHHITAAVNGRSDRSPKAEQLQLGGGGGGGSGVGAAGVGAGVGGVGTANSGLSSNYGLGNTGTGGGVGGGINTSSGAPHLDDVAPDAQAPSSTFAPQGVGAGAGAGAPGIGGPGAGGVEANESVASGRKVPGEA